MDDTEPDQSANNDLAVDISTLEENGVRPKVGDQVDVKVGGKVSKIVDDCVYVTPETCNDMPMAHRGSTTPDEDMQSMAMQAGPIQGY